jgi:hypothetical protein
MKKILALKSEKEEALFWINADVRIAKSRLKNPKSKIISRTELKKRLGV